MPALLDHEGLWHGAYRHVDAKGGLLDEHASEVRCEFPQAGEHAYVQHNRFTWPDGREVTSTLPGVLKHDRLYWDTEAFSGYAWQTEEGVIMLRLDRKDEPGVHFIEAIVLAHPTALERARTWHWFENGALIRRTLCHEHRAD